MKKGCGFIFLSIIGLTAISILYYTLTPIFNESTASEESSSTMYTTGYVADVLEFTDENDPGKTYIVPIMEFTVSSSFILDTAYHLRTQVDANEIYSAAFVQGDLITLAVDANDYENYKVAAEIDMVSSQLLSAMKEYTVVLLIIGGILLLVFLRGLSKTFAYKEPPASERM
ncbi:MAG: hypothetical protein ABJH05_07460 [Fulvivirga sp.]